MTKTNNLHIIHYSLQFHWTYVLILKNSKRVADFKRIILIYFSLSISKNDFPFWGLWLNSRYSQLIRKCHKNKMFGTGVFCNKTFLMKHFTWHTLQQSTLIYKKFSRGLSCMHHKYKVLTLLNAGIWYY